MIELKNINKVYPTNLGPHLVLDDISVTFRPGESIGILGRNGAGKSTLMRIIGGAEMPTSGSVTRSSRVSWPIGFAGGFNGSLTGEENCRFVARIYAQPIDRVVDDTRAFAEIGDYFYVPVRTYSSGMRARLAFGLSMAIDFEIYLVDEVTSVGDRPFRRKCAAAFAERKERSGLILVSHEMATLREHCERGALLDKGRLHVFDSVDEASAAYEERLTGAAV